MPLKIPLHSCAASERERPGLRDLQQVTQFFRCPSESKVGITPGILKYLQPSAQLSLIHMD